MEGGCEEVVGLLGLIVCLVFWFLGGALAAAVVVLGGCDLVGCGRIEEAMDECFSA